MATIDLLVATRKGLFVTDTRAASPIAAPHFAGDPVTFTLVDRRDGAWYAALRLGHFGVKLKRSRDRGQSWQEIATPAFPKKPQTGPWADDPTPWSVDLVWVLAEGGSDQPQRLWAGCLPAGLFYSNDSGASWNLAESLWLDERRRAWFGGGYDHAAIHSIAVDPRDSQHVTVAISCGGIWESFDDGATWQLIGRGQVATYMPESQSDDPNTQDPHRLDHCKADPDTVWVQNHCGTFLSRNGAKDFERLAPPAGYDFGFAVLAHPSNPQRAWFVPAISDTCRYAVDAALCVMRTSDGGITFELLRNGLPQQHAWQLIYRHALCVDDSGDRLAMGSTTGQLWITNNAGDAWTTLAAAFPPIAALTWDMPR